MVYNILGGNHIGTRVVMIVPINGMEIDQDVTFIPGVYHLADGIKVIKDEITIDGNGALIVGSGKQGNGVSIESHTDVVVKNLNVLNYHHGISVKESLRPAILNCQVTGTAEITANTIFLDIWRPAENAYGAGIFFWNVDEGIINSNNLQHQMNGLLAYGCDELIIKDNNASYCSGFGFHLYQTCNSLVENNYADYCCRYEPRGEGHGHMGADSAGFLVINGSCHNTFRGNYARLGGDGFFLAGLTPQLVLAGCNDNLFEKNDGSYSPNIAFEATFSSGNIYRNNRANFCNYGFWCGFSNTGTIENNQILENRQAGIAVENGYDFKIEHNTFKRNGHGILLWSKSIPAFTQAVPANDTSYGWQIVNNEFDNNWKAIRIAADQDHGVRPLSPGGEYGFPAPIPHHHAIVNNTIHNSIIGIEIFRAEGTAYRKNHFSGNRQDIQEES
jgi:parallel beta-helix repeat protein